METKMKHSKNTIFTKPSITDKILDYGLAIVIGFGIAVGLYIYIS
jgi:hypothetical protein